MSFNELELKQFTGTNHYYSHWTRSLVYTDGIQFLCNNGAAWLVDAIASYQSKKQITQDSMLQEYQFWTLRVDLESHKAVLACERDTNDIVLTQNIDYTDFPLSGIKLYLVESGQRKVLMLPSEY